MIGMNAQVLWRLDSIQAKRLIAPARRRYLNRAGAILRKMARGSIKRKGTARKMPKKFTSQGKVSKAWIKWREEVRSRPAAPPGSPIHTHTGAAKNAIQYGYDPNAESVVVGFSATGFDQVGELHEYGGARFGKRYPKRPVMQPALSTVQPKLPKLWADSIK